MYFRMPLRTVVLAKVFKKKTNNETDFDWLNQKGIYCPATGSNGIQNKVTVNLEPQQEAGIL